MKYALTAIAVPVGVALGVLLTVLVGIRFQIPTVLRGVRTVARNVTNPRVLAKAGTAEAGTAVIRHVGRRSGHAYRTPIDAIEVDGDYVIALPYGTTADWVRNVQAAGGATLELRGDEIALGTPKLISLTEIIDDISAAEALPLRIFGVAQGLRFSPTE